MEENPRKGGTQLEASRNGHTDRKHRYTDEDDETAGHRIKCSGEYSSRSCAAGIIADCVAVCCCPCAVVNLLTLAFVKVPYMMGRKCLGRRKKKKKREIVLEIREREGIFWREKEMGVEIGEELGMEKEENNYSARFEAEKVWLELYQVGDLGFGRVSFTGIHSPL